MTFAVQEIQAQKQLLRQDLDQGNREPLVADLWK
jgi:hypothetical protein